MKKIVIPVFGDRVSPRLDLSAKVRVIIVEDNHLKSDETVSLICPNKLERINMIVGLNPDEIIRDGLSDLCKAKILNNGIRLYSWVQGETDGVIKDYLKGKLKEK